MTERALTRFEMSCLRGIADGDLVVNGEHVDYLVAHGYAEVKKRWFREPWYRLTPKGRQVLED